MSSKIRRPDDSAEFPALAWSIWSTELVDRASPPVRESVHPPSDAADQLQRRFQEEAEAAYKRGYREGEASGKASGRREVEEASRQMSLTVQSAVREKARLRAEAEVDVVRLSLAIARRILHREVHIDSGVALGLVKAAMQTVGAREMQVVRTTPSMAPALTAGMAAIGVPEGVKVVADASLEPGGLVVETSRGEVDASLEVQFEEISRGLLQTIEDAGRRA